MKIVGKILATIFSFLYFFMLTVLMIVVFALNFFSTDYYANIFKDIDLKAISVKDFETDYTDDAFEEDATVEDALISYFTTGGVDEELAVAIINNEKIREVFGKFVGDYIIYNVGGEKPTIAREDVVAIFNEEDVKKLLEENNQNSNVDIDKIYNQLNDFANEAIEEDINNDNGEVMAKIISLTSNGMIWIYVTIFFILSYLFTALLTWNFIKPLKYLGIPTIITGILLIIMRFSSSLLISIFETISDLSLIKSLIPSLMMPVLINGLICLILGIVMIITYSIIVKKKSE